MCIRPKRNNMGNPSSRTNLRKRITIRFRIILAIAGLAALLASCVPYILSTGRLALHSEKVANSSSLLTEFLASGTGTLHTTKTDAIAVDPSRNQPPVIAYAVSLIKCGDFQSSTDGLNDAAVVLRHSVHQTSIRNPASGSKYDYKMYAIVHSQAKHCTEPLSDAGFEILLRDAPVRKNEIRGEYLRKHIRKEWCCGADEFVKLYAYKIEDHPIVVHMDIDFVLLKPMDDLFDAMLLDPQASLQARSRIPLERPADPWPERVDAFMTRDWGQVIPGRKALFQAGFIVVRPDPKIFDLMVDTIKEGNFVQGFSRANGWGGLGK